MHVQKMRTIARNLGIEPANLDHVCLIRTARIFIGNFFDCFGTAYDGASDLIQAVRREYRLALASGGRPHAS